MSPAPTTTNLLLLTCLMAGACGDQSPSTLMVRQTQSSSGDGQTQLVDTYLHDPIRVVITEEGNPKAGVSVAWETSGLGATVGQSTISGQDGIAQTFWKLPNTAGPQRATATVAGAAGSPVTFTATALPGPPSRIFIEAGDGQTQASGMVFSEALAVRVTDRLSNRVAQVPVHWQVTSGSVILGAAVTTSDTDGIAEVELTAGTLADAAIVTAALASGSPSVVFHLTVGPP